MHVSPETVARERVYLLDNAGGYVDLINETRERLSEHFDEDVAPVDPAMFREAVEAVFAVGDRAVNVAALMAILRELDVREDYPGFVVDELLGRQLAAAIAGGEPRGTLAEATFHYIDIVHHPDGTAGADDLDAGVAAGFQTRLPGWPWVAATNPFEPG